MAKRQFWVCMKTNESAKKAMMEWIEKLLAWLETTSIDGVRIEPGIWVSRERAENAYDAVGSAASSDSVGQIVKALVLSETGVFYEVEAKVIQAGEPISAEVIKRVGGE